MTGQATRAKSFHNGLVVLVTLILSPAGAYADCAKDRTGEVYCGAGACISDRNGIIWCSRYYDGGAQRTRKGKVLCGRGQCVRDSHGIVFCSSQVGGSALRDSRGQVRCFGQCEPARAEWCENRLAGSSG
jgi:hypothetical protein